MIMIGSHSGTNVRCAGSLVVLQLMSHVCTQRKSHRGELKSPRGSSWGRGDAAKVCLARMG